MPDSLPHSDLISALPRLRRYARVLTRDHNRADDLVQDTLTRAWEKRGLWRAGSNLCAWLLAIMHNVHANQHALRRRELAQYSLDADDGPMAGWEIPVPAAQSDHVEAAEMLRQIDRLPGEQREIIVLAALRELRYEEIAAELGIPIGTVMSRLARARDKLRRMATRLPAPHASEPAETETPRVRLGRQGSTR